MTQRKVGKAGKKDLSPEHNCKGTLTWAPNLRNYEKTISEKKATQSVVLLWQLKQTKTHLNWEPLDYIPSKYLSALKLCNILILWTQEEWKFTEEI